MYDTKREETKAAILKRIEDSETFTIYEVQDGLGAYAHNIARGILQVMISKGELDYEMRNHQYIYFKVKG